MTNTDKSVELFYKNFGWKSFSQDTNDSLLFEDLRDVSRDYVSKCRLRLNSYIPYHGNRILDFASGPIQYPEYLSYSDGYKKRWCVDLSKKAIEIAKKRIGKHGKFINKNFFDINFNINTFDCIISLHTIYHIQKNKQEKAVIKLINAVKKGRPVVIVYSNPNHLLSKPIAVYKYFLDLFISQKLAKKPIIQELYFYRYPLEWWLRFSNLADVKIYVWRTFDSKVQKKLFPDNWIGKKMFKLLFWMENKFPRFFSRIAVYPIIVLNKK